MEKQLTEAELNMRAKAFHDNHFNHVQHAYIDIAGDLIAGTLLARILWWFAPNEKGETKLRVKKDGHLWLAKSREDWWEEIRITPKQYDRAIKILRDKELIVKKIYKFNRDPMTHLRPNFEKIEIELHKWLNNIKQMIIEGEIDKEGRKTNSPKGKKPVKTRDKADFSGEYGTNKKAKPQEHQGEAPNPLGNLVFPQKGKTEFPFGEKGNYPKGEKEFNQSGKSLTGNTDREYGQGIRTGNTLDNHHMEKPEENSVVVDENKIHFTQQHIQYLFGTTLSDTQVIRLLNMCTQVEKNIVDVIQETHTHFAKTREAITDLMGALVYGVKYGWEQTTKGQAEPLLYQSRVEYTPYNWVEGE